MGRPSFIARSSRSSCWNAISLRTNLGQFIFRSPHKVLAWRLCNPFSLNHGLAPRKRHATVTGERLLGFAEPKCKNPGIPAGVSRSCAGPAPLEHCEGSSAPFLLGRSCKQARRTQRRYSPDQHGVPPSRASIPSEFRCKNDPRRAGRVRATSLCVQSWPRARPRLWSRKTARPPPTWHLCRAI